MKSICDIIQKQQITISEATTSTFNRSNETKCLQQSTIPINVKKIKCMLNKGIPYFSDLNFKYLNILILDVYNPINGFDVIEQGSSLRGSSSILIPLIKLKREKMFMKLFQSFQNSIGVILLNTYKLEALSIIFGNMALNIMFDLATNGNKVLNNPSDFYEFLTCLRSTIQNTDLHLLIKLGKKFNYNVIVFRNMETNCIFYQNTSINGDLILFRYISLNNIKFCERFDSFDEFRTNIYENQKEIQTVMCNKF